MNLDLDLGLSYKILKYKLKLKNAIDKKNYNNIKKYYSHLKFHIIQGGDGTKYDFRELDNLLKSNNIKNFEKFTLIQYKDYKIGNAKEENENDILLQEYQNNYLTDSIFDYHTKLSSELNILINVGCDIERIINNGKINEYSNQCFWISIIDFLKSKNIIIDIEKIRIEAVVVNTPKNFDTNFEQGKYLIGAAKIASKYNLTIVIYNINTYTNKIINSPYGPKLTEMLIIGNGSQIILISSQNNTHFELITSIKCNTFNKLDTLNLIWDNNTITSNKDENEKKNISDIIKKKRDQIYTNILHTVCFESEEYFGFENFNFVTKLKSIGIPPENKYIKLIEYENNDYISQAILKSSRKKSADNIYYEYLVGNFLNTQSKYFPCFVNTYGVFKYKNDIIYENIVQCNTIDNNYDINELKTGLTIIKDSNINIDEYLKQSCINSTHIAILIESLKNAQTIMEILKDKDFCNNQLLYVLFQIYMPLSVMAENFTHYDLHYKNVLVYEPSKEKVIKYHYHINKSDHADIITFYSPYIVKIINYNTCYFNDGITNSKIIYDKVSTISECQDSVHGDCEKYKGYYWLNSLNSNFNLVSSQKNISYDLKLLWYIFNNSKFKYSDDKSGLSQLQTKLNYNEGKFIDENLSNDENINNVNDVFNELKNLILLEQNKLNNDTLKSKDLIGDLHIYSDNLTPIKFEEFKK